MLTRDDIIEALRADDLDKDNYDLFNSFSECDRREVAEWACSGSNDLQRGCDFIWQLWEEDRLEDFLDKVLTDERSED